VENLISRFVNNLARNLNGKFKTRFVTPESAGAEVKNPKKLLTEKKNYG
jgi:hypothetical protein